MTLTTVVTNTPLFFRFITKPCLFFYTVYFIVLVFKHMFHLKNFTIVIECGAPPNGINTVEISPDVTLFYKESYNYSCLEGYDTDEEVITTCLGDSSLSLDPPPTCGK